MIQKWYGLGMLLVLAGCEGIGQQPGQRSVLDPSIAVSPSYIVQWTNDGIGVADRALHRLTPPDLYNLLLPNCFGGDGRVYWDDGASRWYVVTLDNYNTAVCLAVSKTSDFYGGFSNYYFPSAAGGVDQPSLGWGTQNLVLVQRNQAGGAWVLDKGAALTGRQVAWAWFPIVGHPDAYAIHPGGNYFADTFAAEIGLQDSNLQSNTIRLWRFHGVPPNVTADRDYVATQLYGNPPAINQPAPGPYLSVQGSVLEDATTASTPTRAYVAVHDGYLGHAAARVFEIRGIDSTGFNLSLAGSTAVYLDGNHFFWPSLAIDASGNLWIAGNCSGSALFVSLCVGHRGPDSLPSALNTTLIKGGTAVYCPGCTGPVRWGDYTTIARDPTDPNTLYVTAEVALDASLKHSWIATVHQ